MNAQEKALSPLAFTLIISLGALLGLGAMACNPNPQGEGLREQVNPHPEANPPKNEEEDAPSSQISLEPKSILRPTSKRPSRNTRSPGLKKENLRPPASQKKMGGGMLYAAHAGGHWGRLMAPLVLDRNGVDSQGWFHPPKDQEVTPIHVQKMLENLDLGEKVLSRGELIDLKSLEDNHLIFQATLLLAEDDAKQLGRDQIRVAFKPSTRGIYGREYRRELLFYLLGRHLKTQGLIPIVERQLKFAPLEAQIQTLLTPKQWSRLKFYAPPGGELYLRGSLQLWVENFRPIFGRHPTSFSFFKTLAGHLQRGKNPSPESDPLWQGISDMFVLDFLIYNSDRAREGGAVRLSNGRHRLVMLDNGDALLIEYPDVKAPKCRELFEKVRLFSPNVVEGIAALDEQTLRSLWIDAEGVPLAQSHHIRRVAARAKEATKHIQKLGKKRRKTPGVLFKQTSLSRSSFSVLRRLPKEHLTNKER